jgi:hypothetical protein
LAHRSHNRGLAPVSWFYARTLHHIDRLVYRKRASHRHIPAIELTPVE